MTDESITKFAKKHRMTAAAALVQIVRDESAPANARAQAARDILSYSDGRPSTAKPISRADLHNLDEATKREIFDALLIHFSGTGLEALMADLIPGFAALPSPTKKTNKATKPVLNNRFRRGPPKPPRPSHIPPDWGQGGYARPNPVPGGPADAAKAVAASTIAANPEQGPSGAGQDGDHRLTPTPSNLPTLGLVEHLPPNGMSFDAFGNLVPNTRWRH